MSLKFFEHRNTFLDIHTIHNIYIYTHLSKHIHTEHRYTFYNLKENPRMKMKPAKQGGCSKEFEYCLIPGLKAVEESDPAISVTTVSVHVSMSLNRFT